MSLDPVIPEFLKAVGAISGDITGVVGGLVCLAAAGASTSTNGA